MQPYNVLLVQPSTRCVFPSSTAPIRKDAIAENIDHTIELIRPYRSVQPRLVVLPEFAIQGMQFGRSVDEWIDVSLTIPGPETDRLSSVAADMNCYIAAMFYELDPEWPGRFWNTAFIVSPSREIVLKYRKIFAMTAKTRPGDVWSDYLERYGVEGLLPVVDTEIGRLAAIVCYDINFPELSRCLALRGAEVLCHVTSEPDGQHRSSWDNARRTRAYENLFYLAAANQGPQPDREGDYVPSGGSKLVGFRGEVLAEAQSTGEEVVVGRVDIDALRRQRANFRLNFLAQVQPRLFLETYEAAAELVWPTDHWLERPIQDVTENEVLGREVIRRMQAASIFVAPEGGSSDQGDG